MDSISDLIPEIRAFRAFLPAKAFETSLRFYKTIGFQAYPLGETLAGLSFGRRAFLLQGYYVREWAENMVMHVLVNDVSAWWRHIHALDLAAGFGVTPPAAPKLEPWGLKVAYVFDPSGGLWHFAEVPEPDKSESRRSRGCRTIMPPESEIEKTRPFWPKLTVRVRPGQTGRAARRVSLGKKRER